jgi:hypothetical protein
VKSLWDGKIPAAITRRARTRGAARRASGANGPGRRPDASLGVASPGPVRGAGGRRCSTRRIPGAPSAGAAGSGRSGGPSTRGGRCRRPVRRWRRTRGATSPPETASRSRTRYRGCRPHGVASITCRQIKVAVRWAVKFQGTSSRLPGVMTSRMSSVLKGSVWTVKRAAAQSCGRWFARKVRQVWRRGRDDPGRRSRRMDRRLTALPTVSRSLRLRSVPQRGWSRARAAISSRASALTRGRPSRGPDRQHQTSRQAWRCERTTVSGRTRTRWRRQPRPSRRARTHTSLSPAGTGEDRQLVTQEQVLGAEVGAVAQAGADGPKEQDEALEHVRRMHDPGSIQPFALPQHLHHHCRFLS